MPLSCGCDDYPEPGMIWTEWGGQEYITFEGLRRKRCTNCNCQISPGDTVIKFNKYKAPEHDVEIAIYGEEGQIPRAPSYLCERCADVWFSLQEAGFDCVGPWEVGECLDDYVELAKEQAELAAQQEETKQASENG